MSEKRLFKPIIISFSLILALAALGVLLIGLPPDAKAQGPGKAPGAAQASVGTGFTYQGYLIQSGSPVSDTCDFQLPMYDAANGGNYLTSAAGTAAVKNGYFNITLDYGADAFQGDARWLEVFVRCPSATGSYTKLDGRIAINPAPYALSLKPGAVISGSASGASFSANNTYDGMLVSYGVQGTSQYVGVMGAGESAGVQGESSAAGGKGVYGYASHSSGVNYGVYGQSDSPNGYGVYSEGNAHVTGNLETGSLNWGAKTSFISVPAAAFTAQDRSPSTHHNYGYLLTSGASPYDIFYAPVQLPHQATITGLSFSWIDNSSTYNITCTLYVDAMGAVGPENHAIARTISSGSSGTGRSVTSTIEAEYATVDNSKYIYYLSWDLTDFSTKGRGVIIEYTISEPY